MQHATRARRRRLGYAQKTMAKQQTRAETMAFFFFVLNLPDRSARQAYSERTLGLALA